MESSTYRNILLTCIGLGVAAVVIILLMPEPEKPYKHVDGWFTDPGTGLTSEYQNGEIVKTCFTSSNGYTFCS